MVTSRPLAKVATGGGLEVRAIVMDDGSCPVEEFLEQKRLRSDRAEFYANMNKFLRAGFAGRGSAFKSLHHHPNVWQLAAESHRILGFRWGNVLVLTNGFEKKRNDTEQKHIDCCEERRAAFHHDQGVKP